MRLRELPMTQFGRQDNISGVKFRASGADVFAPRFPMKSKFYKFKILTFEEAI